LNNVVGSSRTLFEASKVVGIQDTGIVSDET
jgi:hypothetical protein